MNREECKCERTCQACIEEIADHFISHGAPTTDTVDVVTDGVLGMHTILSDDDVAYLDSLLPQILPPTHN
jgi:hypothetical protein